MQKYVERTLGISMIASSLVALELVSSWSFLESVGLSRPSFGWTIGNLVIGLVSSSWILALKWNEEAEFLKVVAIMAFMLFATLTLILAVLL